MRNSKDKTTLSKQSLKKQFNSLQKSKPMKLFDIPEINLLKSSFHKEIEIPIDFQTSIFLSKTPQRCLTHNNVVTLYCVYDKKPLCVTCMYQSALHRKHKVIPLNRATDEMEEEMKVYLKDVETKISLADNLIKKSNENLVRLDKQIPQILQRVVGFYANLNEILLQKKGEQIKHIQDVWNRLKFQYGSFANQLTSINYYIVEKIKEISERSRQENILFNRNILHTLSRGENIFSSSMCDYHELKYADQLKRFYEVEEIVNKNLFFSSVLPFKQKRQTPSRNKSQRNPISPPKKSLTPVKDNNITFQKDSIKQKSKPKERSKTPVISKKQNTEERLVSSEMKSVSKSTKKIKKQKSVSFEKSFDKKQ